MFKIEMWETDRWVSLGGTFATREEAEDRVVAFQLASVKKRRRQYRIVRY